MYTALVILISNLLTKHFGECASEYKSEIGNGLVAERSNEGYEVCYAGLGCFPGIGFGTYRLFPASPEEQDVQFLLYNKHDINKPEVLNAYNISLIYASTFNASRDMKLIIHGLLRDCHDSILQYLILSLFVAAPEENILCVNWKKGSAVPFLQASANTQVVGAIIAQFIRMIDTNITNINNRTHMIGFSLGAHTAGIAGSKLKNISRITGLDPAGQIFYFLGRDLKLDPTDADFVDVIHTYGRLIVGYGYLGRIGDIDFYVNGGEYQPHCKYMSYFNYLEDVLGISTEESNCDHRMAVELFATSMTSSVQLYGFSCRSYKDFLMGQCFSPEAKSVQMGYFTNTSSMEGDLYLITRREYPYYGPQFLFTLDYVSADGLNEYNGTLYLVFKSKKEKNDTIPILRNFTAPNLVKVPVVADPTIAPFTLQLLYVDSRLNKTRKIEVCYATLTDAYGLSVFYYVEGNILYEGVPTDLRPKPN